MSRLENAPRQVSWGTARELLHVISVSELLEDVELSGVQGFSIRRPLKVNAFLWPDVRGNLIRFPSCSIIPVIVWSIYKFVQLNYLSG